MHSNRHHLFKEGSWLLARKLESFTRHSWMLLSFGEKTFHHIHCACHKTNCQLFHNVIFLLRSAPASSSQTSTYCIKCVHTQLLNPTQHIKYYPFPSDLETSKLHFLGSLGKKCACAIPDDENMHEDSMYSWSSFQLSSVPQWQLSAPAKHSGTRS